MPLLARFIGTIATFFVEIFAKFLGYKAALALASFTAWLAVLAAFVTAVSVCLNALHGTIQAGVSAAGPWAAKAAMGLGMFIPSNAGAVLSCMASVWIGCAVYKIRKTGIHNYSK